MPFLNKSALAPFMIAAVLSLPAYAGEIAGQATVIDGDTIEIHGERIRLASVDAPESAQLCHDASGKPWRCGQRAALALVDFINRRPVACQSSTRDRYGRALASCAVGGVDLGNWLVSNGWAVPYYDKRREHSQARDSAAAAKLGIWQGAFVLPKDWRAGKATANRPDAVEKRRR